METSKEQHGAVQGVDGLLEGTEPCTPERVQEGDVVIALLCLGTRLSIRYIFEQMPLLADEKVSRDVKNIQVFHALPPTATLLERRGLCDEAIDDLDRRFAGKIHSKAMNVLRIFIAEAVLDPDDPARPMPISSYDPRVVNAELGSFLIMDLSRFDKLGRMTQ